MNVGRRYLVIGTDQALTSVQFVSVCLEYSTDRNDNIIALFQNGVRIKGRRFYSTGERSSTHTRDEVTSTGGESGDGWQFTETR